MNETLFLWNGLFLAVTAALLAAPMWPAWQEWRRPKDRTSSSLDQATPAAARPLARHGLLTASAVAPAELQATHSILVTPGSHFKKLMAPRIQFGTADMHAPQREPGSATVPLVVPTHWPHATRWGADGWRIEGDCRIPASHRLDGALVVTGSLAMEHDSVVHGDLKVHGDVRLSPRAVVTGALTCKQHIDLGRACTVQGPVLCAGDLSIGDAVVLGSAHTATSVLAEHIRVRAAATVHGTVCARSSGQVTWVA
jgi:cytoskeletal protein CcmA (bactofilin family)